MRKRVVISLVVLLSVLLLLSACSNPGEPQPGAEGGWQHRENDGQIVPKNVISMGEAFEVYPMKADGHLLCTVTGVRLVTEETECPPREHFPEPPLLSATVDGDSVNYEYEEWFTEGGAFDQGCRIMLVDVTVTNVDAVAWLDNGTSNSDRGLFLDPYAFYAYHITNMVNLEQVISQSGDVCFALAHAFCFSEAGKYSEDIRETMGYEPGAIQILPGQTVTYTLGYPVHTNTDGSTPDPSNLWLCVHGGETSRVETGIFIDTKLGDDPK